MEDLVDGFLTVIFILLAISIAGNLGRMENEKKSKLIKGMSVEQLEEKLEWDNSHALELRRKTGRSENEGLMLKQYTEESKAIAVELHDRTGKKYKDADELFAEASRSSARRLSPDEQAAAAKALLGSLDPKKKEKDASVVGRAVVGGLIAGETGAVVGAISALDKNSRKNKD